MVIVNCPVAASEGEGGGACDWRVGRLNLCAAVVCVAICGSVLLSSLCVFFFFVRFAFSLFLFVLFCPFFLFLCLILSLFSLSLSYFCPLFSFFVLFVTFFSFLCLLISSLIALYRSFVLHLVSHLSLLRYFCLPPFRNIPNHF